MTNSEKKECALAAQSLLRRCHKAALGTLLADGSPLVTLVALAISKEGIPLLLLSRLATHTQNIMRDPRASLLLEENSGTSGTSGTGDPMTGARLSLSGRIVAVEGPALSIAKKSFVARHPDSEPYDTELDFNYYHFEIKQGRFNQGFGRFRKLGPNDLLVENPATDQASR